MAGFGDADGQFLFTKFAGGGGGVGSQLLQGLPGFSDGLLARSDGVTNDELTLVRRRGEAGQGNRLDPQRASERGGVTGPLILE